jgi:hypothetical protein
VKGRFVRANHGRGAELLRRSRTIESYKQTDVEDPSNIFVILNQISWLNYIRQPVLHNAG